jgi:hypothetical protein
MSSPANHPALDQVGTLALTSLGNKPLEDLRYTGVVGEELRALLAAVATLIATRAEKVDSGEDFMMDAIGVCMFGSAALTLEP